MVLDVVHGGVGAIGGLPFLMLATCAKGAETLIKKPRPGHMEELGDILQATEDFVGKPWWEEVMEGPPS